MKKLLLGMGKAMLPIFMKWGFVMFLRTMDTPEERKKIAADLNGKLDLPNLSEEEEMELINNLLDVLYNDLLVKLK